MTHLKTKTYEWDRTDDGRLDESVRYSRPLPVATQARARRGSVSAALEHWLGGLAADVVVTPVDVRNGAGIGVASRELVSWWLRQQVEAGRMTRVRYAHYVKGSAQPGPSARPSAVKVCTKCKQVKDIEDFAKRYDRVRARRSYCKQCAKPGKAAWAARWDGKQQRLAF